jgi:hypothetical protein
MSRHTLYQDDRLTLIGGVDHILGEFLQLYDKEMQNETPEGEGLVFDWSKDFGTERNFTGISDDAGKKPIEIINQYINEINGDYFES